MGIEPDLENLRNYSGIKLALADQLRTIRQGLVALDRKNAEQQCLELMTKLAEDRFVLAVLGQFKRGKSSLMNAIVGRPLLPTGVLPLTSVITILKFGPEERLRVNRNNSSFPEEFPVSGLPDLVTEKGNPDNKKNIKTVEVELPVAFLQRGLEFVDTPGVGSSFTANTTTTYSFLPQCDAVLFVTGADTPLTSLELSLLNEIRQYVSRIFFVVNKIDLVNGDERGEIIEFISRTIRERMGDPDIKIFPLSSGLALEAKISGDDTLYKESGLSTLEDALASFLSMEKAGSFLAVVARRALQLLNDEEASGIFEERSLALRAIAIQNEEPTGVQTDPHEAALALEGARTNVKALYQNILDGKRVATAGESKQPVVMKRIILKAAGQLDFTPLANTESISLEVAADLLSRTCPVCHHLTKQTSDFFSHWQYRLVTEEQARLEFAAELGFCPLHAWQLLAVSSPYGASVGYASLAGEFGRRMQEQSGAFSGGDKIMHLVHNSGNCRVCKLLREVEKEYVSRLRDMIGDTAGQNAYRESQGTCLWHLGMLLNVVRSDKAREFLLSHAARLFQQDAEDMRSYALKRDALRRSLQNRNEEDAYRRAVTRIVGARSVCVPWAEDGEI